MHMSHAKLYGTMTALWFSGAVAWAVSYAIHPDVWKLLCIIVYSLNVIVNLALAIRTKN